MSREGARFNEWIWMRLAFASIAVTVFLAPLNAQKPSGPWLRIQTGEDYRIDVNRTSGSIDEDGCVTATFHTIFDKDQTLEGKSTTTTYRVREDRIQFDGPGNRYRFVHISFLNSARKVVATTAPDTDWRLMRSKSSLKLFNSAMQLPPFGYWRIISYRYASGGSASKKDPQELKKLIGSKMQLEYSGVRVGETICEKPSFRGKLLTMDEFEKRFGIGPASIGLPNIGINALMITCDLRPDSQTRSFVLGNPNEKGLMLWDGVFLEVQRIGKLFNP